LPHYQKASDKGIPYGHMGVAQIKCDENKWDEA
jgi:hypothetical protein